MPGLMNLPAILLLLYEELSTIMRLSVDRHAHSQYGQRREEYQSVIWRPAIHSDFIRIIQIFFSETW